MQNLQTSATRFATLFLIAIFIATFHILGEDEALEYFLAKDQEEELQWHKTSMAETRKLVRDVMQRDWGQGEVVHPKKAKELILQVTISFRFNSLIQ